MPLNTLRASYARVTYSSWLMTDDGVEYRNVSKSNFYLVTGFVTINKSWACVHEALQASHDKRTRPPGWHRNCIQTSPRKREIICMHFKKGNISWGQRSVDAITGLHRPQKKHSPRSEFTPEQVDLEVDGQPPADSPPRDHLITMVKETVKKSFEKMQKK